MDWSFLWYIAGTLTAIIGGVWSLAWWFARQFSNIAKAITETKDAILAKLEYHEKHDDQRFAEVRKDIWEIRLRNAAIDGRVERRLKQQQEDK